MATRFTGPQQRGATAARRKRKRLEAEARNARTLPHKRRAYWRELATADVADAQAAADAACQWPWKTSYANQAIALAALTGMSTKRKGQGLHPYPCPAGHWHLGRLIRRSTVAWRAVA